MDALLHLVLLEAARPRDGAWKRRHSDEVIEEPL
jgi:hypothetical protein